MPSQTECRCGQSVTVPAYGTATCPGCGAEVGVGVPTEAGPSDGCEWAQNSGPSSSIGTQGSFPHAKLDGALFLVFLAGAVVQNAGWALGWDSEGGEALFYLGCMPFFAAWAILAYRWAFRSGPLSLPERLLRAGICLAALAIAGAPALHVFGPYVLPMRVASGTFRYHCARICLGAGTALAGLVPVWLLLRAGHVWRQGNGLERYRALIEMGATVATVLVLQVAGRGSPEG